MRIAQVNMLHYGSTGKIMLGIADRARQEGHLCETFSPRVYWKHRVMDTAPIAHHHYFGSREENRLHLIADRLFGLHGFFSVRGTKQLVRMLKEFKPDVVHLHNLHHYTMSLPILFRYLKSSGCRVVWTLHDCWPMTGRCFHFSLVGCEKWKIGCGNCPQRKEYPSSKLDLTSLVWKKKKAWFSGIQDMIVVTPSVWLGELVKQSFLGQYPVQVIHNGIDLKVFRPTDSDVRTKYGISPQQKLILGVAFDWDYRKGLDVFTELAKRLDDRYRIVLVGTSESVDRLLPENIISIHRTKDQKELAAIYTAADLFVIPTREENYPTVSMEALACGTPVLTFRTGGSPEIPDETCGSVVPRGDVDALERELRRIVTEEPYSRGACLERARSFDRTDRYGEYLKLYQK